MANFLRSALLFVPLCLNPVYAESLEFIDTQAQFDPVDSDFNGSLETMLKEMDRVGIRKTLIVPPPFPFKNPRTYDAETIVKIIGDKKNRFGFLGGGESLNVTILETPPSEVTSTVRAKFRARCEEILSLGALGFGEVTAEHLSLPLMKGSGMRHFHNSAEADHPLLRLLADIAAEKDVPIDIHFDIFPMTMTTPSRLAEGNPAVLKENQAAFERLLSHNRKARFTWAHLGSDPALQRTPALMRDLLTRHGNLYSAFRVHANGYDPTLVLDENGILKPEWLKLIEDFPDRFTMHTDIFYVSNWPPKRGPKKTHELAKRLLEQLPTAIARKLAYENAQRIYKLKD